MLPHSLKKNPAQLQLNKGQPSNMQSTHQDESSLEYMHCAHNIWDLDFPDCLEKEKLSSLGKLSTTLNSKTNGLLLHWQVCNPPVVTWWHSLSSAKWFLILVTRKMPCPSLCSIYSEESNAPSTSLGSSFTETFM